MSDDELDHEWKPSGRPQSTMARSFSLALNDLFKIDNSVADLDAAVEQKKRAVSTQTSELEALQARIKATEERLKQRQSMVFAPNPASMAAVARSTPSQQQRQRRSPIGDTFGSPPKNNNDGSAKTIEDITTPTRPPTGKKEPPPPVSVPAFKPTSNSGNPNKPLPGALPPTPGASSEGESESADEDEESDKSTGEEEESEEEEEAEGGAVKEYVVVPPVGQQKQERGPRVPDRSIRRGVPRS